jgi:hypothetical protein
LMDDKSPALKYLTTPYIFTLKSGGMKDGSERAEKTIEVNHTHTHKLKTPEPVAVKDVSNFVQLEMARAQKISAKKMSEVSILSGDIVEAEVAD